MKTQKIIFSAILVFAGILLFAKTTKLGVSEKKVVLTEDTKVEEVTALSSLKVVWHDLKGQEVAGKLSKEHKAFDNMPYAEKDQYYYDFEKKTIVKKIYAKIDLKKVWNFQKKTK